MEGKLTVKKSSKKKININNNLTVFPQVKNAKNPI
jgi:hypothetical protein